MRATGRVDSWIAGGIELGRTAITAAVEVTVADTVGPEADADIAETLVLGELASGELLFGAADGVAPGRCGAAFGRGAEHATRTPTATDAAIPNVA